ncbi:MAG: serine/threonine protein kinase, partial [Nitrospiraceae bacterium]
FLRASGYPPTTCGYDRNDIFNFEIGSDKFTIMTFGRYQILNEIGKGAMGRVYKARDPNLDLVVALKVLHPERIDSDAFVTRFLREAKVLGRLDRANIIRIYNIDEDSGNIYIAMEYVEGESLRDVMRKKKFSPAEIAEIGRTIANVLDYAHRKGVIHRDIKPSNILIRLDNFLKITDFGIAHIQDPEGHEKTQAGEILGTPGYMSPEQVNGRTIDGRTDLFSLGIILYELCTGIRPFKGDTIPATFQAILNEQPPPVSKINSSVPDGLSKTIMKCLNKKPEDRYQSGKELAIDLDSFRKYRQSETVLMTPPGSKPSSGKTIMYAVSIFLALAISGGLTYVLLTPHDDPGKTSVNKSVMSFLKVNSTPAGAQVFIDSKYEGNTPLKLELPVGKHEIRLTAPSYYDWEAQVKLKEQKETPLNVRLTRLESR